MERVVITNNPQVNALVGSKMKVVFHEEKTYLETMVAVRDLVFKGWKLITHPLYGNLKPHETPYRSIVIEQVGKNGDDASILIMDQSVEFARNLMKGRPERVYTRQIVEDFQYIDASLLENML